ncbi:ATP-binding protein [Streptomyces sp. YIM S03343]
MTNALLHGSLRDRLIRVRLTVDAAGLRIEVSDPRGERLPTARDARGEEQFGRGLVIVGMLADKWGVCPRPAVGKTVWAEWGPILMPCQADSSALAEEPMEWR